MVGSLCSLYSAESGTNDKYADFPWSLHHIVPFWSGAEHHDFHHMAFTNNYATSFRLWDWVFGTDTKYREYKKKVKAARAMMKNATQEERDAFERKLTDEVEKDGIKAEAEAEARGILVAKAKVQ